MIIVLVEGPGDKQALPILVQRELGKSPIRPINMKGKSNIVRQERGFEDTVRRQHALGERSFVVLVDGDVTTPQDPKQWLKNHLPAKYKPRTQACLAQHIDLQQAKRRNASMRAFFQIIKQLDKA